MNGRARGERPAQASAAQAGITSVRLLTATTLTISAGLGLPAVAAPAGDGPCVLETFTAAEVSKAFLVGPAREYAGMSIRLHRAREVHGTARRARSCPRVRNVVSITDTRAGQSSYADGQGWSAAQAAMSLRYYEPATSDPSVAPWATTGIVTMSLRAYQEGASTPIWCRHDTWSVSSAGAQRLSSTQPHCSGPAD